MSNVPTTTVDRRCGTCKHLSVDLGAFYSDRYSIICGNKDSRLSGLCIYAKDGCALHEPKANACAVAT